VPRRARAAALRRATHARPRQLLDLLVWRQVRAKLGGELRLCISGAAPLAPAVLDFIRAMGVTILEGYGLSETSPLVAANGIHGAASCARGTVGHPLPGVTVQIDEAAWAGAQSAGEGELVVFGPCVMQGYWRNKKATREVMSPGGGFRTGDTAIWTPSGHLRITGRLKEQFKLANGRYVSPAPLEEALGAHPAVASVIVDGRGKSAPYALIVPNGAALARLLEDAGVTLGSDLSLAALCAQPRAAAVLLEALSPIFSAPPFRPFEKLQAVLLDSSEWTVANGLLTPSLKTKRQPVLARHVEQIAALG
jgi:long-chain acyl-CoA synthetase